MRFSAPKTTVFKSGRSLVQKLWFLAKNQFSLCGFQMWEEPRPKTAVFSTKNCSFQKWEEPSQKLWFSVWFSNVGGAKAKNHSFQPKTVVFSTKNCGFQKWEEPSQKPQFLAENLAVFSVVFNCGRSLVKKRGFQVKTAVFSVVFNCGRSQGLKLPKTVVFSLFFSQKLWILP